MKQVDSYNKIMFTHNENHKRRNCLTLALPVRKRGEKKKTYLISPLLPNLFIYND